MKYSELINVASGKKLLSVTGQGYIKANGIRLEINETKVEGLGKLDSVVKIFPNSSFSGKLVLLKNKEKAPNFGSKYGQDVEPAGYYCIQKETEYFDNDPKMETKVFYAVNPLIIDVSQDLIAWKYTLSKQFKAKGKTLSKKLKAKGYDCIITCYEDGDTGEIILL